MPKVTEIARKTASMIETMLKEKPNIHDYESGGLALTYDNGEFQIIIDILPEGEVDIGYFDGKA